MIKIEDIPLGAIFATLKSCKYQSFRTTLDVRELGIHFGCVKLIHSIKKGLFLYGDGLRADFTRPVFTAVAFYLCAEKQKVSTSTKNLCHGVFGILNRRDPKVKGNRVLDVLPEKGKFDDGGHLSDDQPELSSYKRHKQMEKVVLGRKPA